MTYTVAIMEVPAAIYGFVWHALKAAGYDSAIDDKHLMLDMTHIGLKIGSQFDSCEMCQGLKGATAGNENIVGGVTMCDYCHSKTMGIWSLARYQARIARWVRNVFGPEIATNKQERCLRLVEEAVELAQACEVDLAQLHKLLDYVYSRPVGDPAQEVAGTMVTLAAAASALDVDLQAVSLAEADRVETPEIIEKVRNRQAEKRARLMTGD